MAEEQTDDPQAAQAKRDARYLEGIVADNENWNDHGIAEPDIAVVFEMGPLCRWGTTFTVGRFRRALKAMRKERVVKVGDRWFPRRSLNASRVRDAGPRRCAGPRCGSDISHLRANALYCSPRCQVAAGRKKGRQAVWVGSETPRSEDRENGDSEGVGPIALDFRSFEAARPYS